MAEKSYICDRKYEVLNAFRLYSKDQGLTLDILAWSSRATARRVMGCTQACIRKFHMEVGFNPPANLPAALCYFTLFCRLCAIANRNTSLIIVKKTLSKACGKDRVTVIKLQKPHKGCIRTALESQSCVMSISAAGSSSQKYLDFQ